ncbi:MAG: glucose-1-phosphate thymidylyltransferase [Patescibacteria group bacterium]
MKALITAGGHGTRLRPITFTLNKHLIPIANKPMIFYVLEKVAAAGIKDVAININPGDKELPNSLGDGKRWKIKITYIEQKGGPKGLAHIIKNAKSFLKKDPFVFYLGDNIFLGGIKKFIETFKKKKLSCLLTLARVPDPQRFGVPEINTKGEIVKVEEKPEKPKSDFAVCGIYIYDHHIIEAVENIKPSARGEFEISDAHQYLLDRGYKVGYEEVSGWWKDTGKPNDLLEANQLILHEIKKDIKGKVEKSATIQGKVVIGKGTKVIGRSFIRGPVVIGENCVIRDSFIGPFTSVGNGVEIDGGDIENCLLMDYVDIKTSKRIVDSLVGYNCSILDDGGTLPSGHKLIIGQNSSIEL